MNMSFLRHVQRIHVEDGGLAHGYCLVSHCGREYVECQQTYICINNYKYDL